MTSILPPVNFTNLDIMVLCLGCVMFIVIFALQRPHGRRSLNKESPDPSCTSEPKPRVFGEWVPISFEVPNIEPHPRGRVEDIEPVSHRPYKWGPDYHVTMGIKNLQWSEWIELDQEFLNYQRIRQWRIRERGARVVRILGDRSWKPQSGEEVQVQSATPAAIELVQEVSKFLSKRYPGNFQLTPAPDGDVVSSFTFQDSEQLYHIPKEAADEHAAARCLETAALMTQDDFILMQEGSDGRYYLQGGIMCNAGSWRLEDKVGMRLDEIHISGEVPHFQEKLQVGMERFFQRLGVDKPVLRLNYGIQQVPNSDKDGVDPEEFAWSRMSLGPEDQLGSCGHNQEGRRKEELNLEGDNALRLRVERQTLRRLPRSGAIVFGIRTYFSEVSKVLDGGQSEDRQRLESALESWPKEVQEYKGWGGELYDSLLNAVAAKKK